eukprot:gnl/Chilomastix_cuspidata/177.p1 GENE.gnl/Chilomastix_cuspidata/177~~gnl/Chilomastix_cuspidata/177.p1  ORF type:complete len:487 (+),score=252.35 gnl/Chilomastix_cuspidata/177:63-1523(+)
MPVEISSLNKNVLRTEYAVRGVVPTMAKDLEKDLAKPEVQAKKSFDKVIWCNIGNPQKLGQKPISFFRETLALCTCPALLETQPDAFSPEAVVRAKAILAGTGHIGIGAYTDSQGMEFIRREVCDFIEARDELPRGRMDPKNIFLTDGASPGVKLALQMLTDSDAPAKSGFLIPVPQYPLYSASIASLGANVISYYLDEEDNWSIHVEEAQRALDEAHKNSIAVRAMVVINPGNPSGAVLDEERIREIVEFADRNSLVLMADEVYQENVYASGKRFFSFERAVYEHEQRCGNRVELVSFHSVSKGFLGECGYRGGYFVLTNFADDVRAEFVKMVSINLCPNTNGQLMVSMMVNPPPPTSAAGALYTSERASILDSLRTRARMASERFNEIEHMSCATVEGALYAFPRIFLPERAIEAAHARKEAPDLMYCKALLEETGIVVVPGSGFLQREGTFHFRCTVLPQLAVFGDFLDRLARFHAEYVARFE